MRLIVAALAMTLLAGAACSWPGSTCNTTIDWINFIQVGDTQYVAGPSQLEEVSEAELGPAYAEVKFKVAGNVCDPAYKPKDGDAAFLEKGTTIYQVKGFPPSQRLAARFDGKLVLYQAFGPAQ